MIPYRGMSDSIRYSVPGMHCDHCVAAVREEVSAVRGVASVDVDLATKRVVVHGDGLDDAALRAAIDEAGYDAEPAA
jgi:copper chaperone